MVFASCGFGIRDGGGMQGGEWKDEFAAPVGDVGKLLGQLGLEVPGQRQHDVGPVLVDLGRIVDRNACPRREATVLVRVAVDGVLEQIAADSAVVEQRVALTGCSVTDDSLALGATVEQESQELVADGLSPRAKLQVAVHVMQAGLLLDRAARRPRVHLVVRRFPRDAPTLESSRHESGSARHRRPPSPPWRARASLKALCSTGNARGRSCRTGRD